MQKRVVVLSLGGSLIIPDKVEINFLKKFKEIIKKNTKNYKFIIVCGGGSIARKYIYALRESGKSEELQSLSGIGATRMNARFMSYFFSQNPWKGIPHKMRQIKKYLRKQDIVFCGALEYHQKQTSDSTSAEIASHFKTDFINLTNVQGLHDKNPLEHKNAKFIPLISWKDFNKMASKKAFKPGQHFVLDQSASKIIMENKITTYILGPDMKQLNNLLNGKKFKGTIIQG
ncbi:MAG: UMP kinase [Nanoarchaeota archaeon]|nr:UMP kinase [Nanoarchaeota archaeon]